jgi:DNA polymerase-4
MDRSIIHLNVADFAVAVERRINRHLASRPVIIVPEGASRAAVYDMSEEAFRTGVRKGMALRRARRLCRDAALLAPHPDRYERAMTELLKRALPYSPQVEPGEGDGHLFVDATGTTRLFGPPVDVAWRLNRQIKKELQLDPIWSVASNKLVAKVATRLVKPSGEYIVAAGDEAAFLAPLPLGLVPGIELVDLARLAAFNFTTVGQVTALLPGQLQVALGRRAAGLHQRLCGIDPSPVLPVDARPPKIRLDHEFGNDTNDRRQIEGVLYGLVEGAGRRLRRQGRAAGRVAVLLDYADGLRRLRQVAAKPATANDLNLFTLGCRALNLAWDRRVRIRHLALRCDGLVSPPAQLCLFADERAQTERRRQLVTALDRIRQRFGDDAVQFGRRLAAA